MLGQKRPRRIAALVGILGVAACGAAGSAAAQPDDREADRAHQRAVERDRQAQERRSTPAAAAERERSRNAHRGISPEQSAALARSTFPAAIVGGTSPLGGLPVRSHLGERTAVVEGRDGQPALAVSHLPLRTPEGSLVDLSLRETRDGFAPKAPLVAMQASSTAAGGFSLPNGLTVTPVAAGDVTGRHVGDAIQYPDAYTDADYLVKPWLSGVEMSWLVRSPASPESFRLRLGLQLGQTAVHAASNTIEIRDAGTLTARLLPPVAFDAQGAGVPARMSLVGADVVEFTMPHRDRDVAYPVLLDPPLISNGDLLNHWNGSNNFGNWQPYDSTGDKYWVYRGSGSDGNGLYVGGFAGRWYDANTNAEWYWQHPTWSSVSTYINSVDLNGIYTDNQGEWFNDFTLYSHRDGAYRDFDSYSQQLGNGTASYTHVLSAWSPGATKVGFSFRSRGTNSGRHQYLNEAIVHLRDMEPPTVSSVSHGGTVNAWSRGGAYSATVTGADPGLGVYSLRVRNTTSTSRFDQTQWHGCQAHPNAHPCPPSWQRAFSYDTGTWPEGIYKMAATAYDVLKPSADSTWDVKVDRTPPQVTPSGALASQKGGIIGAPDYTLRIDATDGDAGAGADPVRARAGVKRLEAYINGTLVYNSGDVACPQNNCPLGRTTPAIPFENLAPDASGAYKVEVKAYDWANNVSPASTFTVYADPELYKHMAPTTSDAPDPATSADTRSCLSLSSYCGDPLNPWIQEATLEGGSTLAAFSVPPATADNPGGYGLSEQRWEAFDRQAFKDLNIHRARLIVSWNVATVPEGRMTDAQLAASGCNACNAQMQETKRVHEWMQKVRAINNANADGKADVQDLQPIVSFGYARGYRNGGPGYEGTGPSAADYEAAVSAFMNRYGDVVRYYTPWNEPNWGGGALEDEPEKAASYYPIVARLCDASRRCGAIAGDFMEGPNLRPPVAGQEATRKDYLRRYIRALNGFDPPVWAIHAYPLGQRRDDDTLNSFYRITGQEDPRSRIWITEAGGLRETWSESQRTILNPESGEGSQESNEAFMLNYANHSDHRRITRYYHYQWWGDDSCKKAAKESCWDAGLARRNSQTMRPVYTTFKNRTRP